MTGLFFGSFNPIHNGHLDIANYILEKGLCEEILFVVSPQNPLKQDHDLLDESVRFRIIESAIGKDSRMQACDIELEMPKPSYTIDTLAKLSVLYPFKEFALIIGGDNLRDFHLWRDHERIAANYKILVYPRPGVDTEGIRFEHTMLTGARLWSISSTEIRERVRLCEDISEFVPAGALSLIVENYR